MKSRLIRYKITDPDTRFTYHVYYPDEDRCTTDYCYDNYDDALECCIRNNLEEFEIVSCRLVLKKYIVEEI